MNHEKRDKVKDPVWLTSFMDVLFILIAFFVLYISFTNISYPPEVSIFFRNASIFNGSNRTRIELPDISPHLAESIFRKEMRGERVEIKKGREGEIVFVFPENILFRRGEFRIRGRVTALDKLAEILKKLPKGTKVIVVGHTDSLPVKRGSNWELSVRRAISVVEYLINKGVDSKMLKAVGVADTQPLVEEVDERSRALNRRVEIKVYLPKVSLKGEKR